MPKPGSEGHGKSGHLSDRLRRKAPRRYFTFTLVQPCAPSLAEQLYFPLQVLLHTIYTLAAEHAEDSVAA